MTKFRNIFYSIFHDSLYSNSLYLMIGTFLMAVSGFLYWIITAKLYSSEEIGIATTLLTATTFITSTSLFGFSISLIRYLPTAKKTDDIINSTSIFVIATTILITAIFFLIIPLIAPYLLFIRNSLLMGGLFIGIVILNSLSQLIENIYISFRSSKYIFYSNIITSILKLALPFLTVRFGAFGIYLSYTLAFVVPFLISLYWLTGKLHYRPAITFNRSILKKMTKFSFGNYIIMLVGGIPAMIFPFLINENLSTKSTAYYYMPMMIATLLYVIPTAATQSFFAEGSASENRLHHHMKKAIRIIAVLMIPAIVILYFFGNFILYILGKNYSLQGAILLRYFSFAGFFVAVNYILGALLRIKHRIKPLFIATAIGELLKVVIVAFFIKHGLYVIGISWITGEMILAILLFIIVKKSNI